MKAEHRKELQTNALAEGMGRVIQGMKERPKGRSVLLWGGVLVVMAALGIYVLWRNASQNSSAESWVRLDTATDLMSIYMLGHDTDDQRRPEPLRTPVAKAARAQVAWYLLYENGIRGLMFDPEAAVQNIEQAKSMFAQLAEECADDPVLGPESLYAIAVAEESLCLEPGRTDKQLKAAAKLYREVKAKYPNSALGREADKRADAITNEGERGPIIEFYTRFAPEIARRRDDARMMKQLQEAFKKQQPPPK